MKTRPTLDSIGDRRAPNLHRTLPTWARQSDGQEVTWRLYVPCAEGGAYFVHVVVPVSITRTDAASRLRAARAGLWSKSRTTADPAASPNQAATAVAAAAPVDEPATNSSTKASTAMNATVADAELEERTLPSGSQLMVPKSVPLAEAGSDSSPIPPMTPDMAGDPPEPAPRQEPSTSDHRQQSLF